MNIDNLYDLSGDKGVKVNANLIEGNIHFLFTNGDGDELGIVLKPKILGALLEALFDIGLLDAAKAAFKKRKAA